MQQDKILCFLFVVRGALIMDAGTLSTWERMGRMQSGMMIDPLVRSMLQRHVAQATSRRPPTVDKTSKCWP